MDLLHEKLRQLFELREQNRKGAEHQLSTAERSELDELKRCAETARERALANETPAERAARDARFAARRAAVTAAEQRYADVLELAQTAQKEADECVEAERALHRNELLEEEIRFEDRRTDLQILAQQRLQAAQTDECVLEKKLLQSSLAHLRVKHRDCPIRSHIELGGGLRATVGSKPSTVTRHNPTFPVVCSELDMDPDMLWEMLHPRHLKVSSTGETKVVLLDTDPRPVAPSTALRDELWTLRFGALSETPCPCCERIMLKRKGGGSWVWGHIRSAAHAGDMLPANAMPLCASCNSSMGRCHLSDFVRQWYPDSVLCRRLPGILTTGGNPLAVDSTTVPRCPRKSRKRPFSSLDSEPPV